MQRRADTSLDGNPIPAKPEIRRFWVSWRRPMAAEAGGRRPRPGISGRSEIRGAMAEITVVGAGLAGLVAAIN